mgnify:CR=1 FL=1
MDMTGQHPRTTETTPIQVVNMGCRLNTAESETMAKNAQDLGLENTVIINTCAVTHEAVRQSRQAIRKARRHNPTARILVTGCAVETDAAAFGKMPEIDQVIGNAQKLNPESLLPATETQAQVQDIMAVREMAEHLAVSTEARTRAFVEIQNGCDHRCTFCIIPYGRGNSRSAPVGDVVGTIKRLVDEGVFEVVLTGVDLTSWGQHLPGEPRLGDLLQRILRSVPNLQRLRLSSLDAIEVDPLLFEIITTEARVAPHLHLSLQAGDTLTLKRMKRRHSRDEAVDLCQRLKAARPDIAFGADLIAGFPTETEAMFQNTLNLVQDCGLSYVHVFPYSPRPGTPAARMPQVPRPEIKDRAKRLREVATKALHRHLDHKIGQVETVVMETETRARAGDFTDLRCAKPLAVGSRQRLRITGHDGQVAHTETQP